VKLLQSIEPTKSMTD